MRLARPALVLLAALAGCKGLRRAPADAGATPDAAAPAASSAPDAGAAYASPSGGFRVRFPGGKLPDVEDKPIPGSAGAVHVFKVQFGSGAYLVVWDDLGRDAARTATEVLDGARSGVLEGTSAATLEAERPILLAGKHPGLDLTVAATTAGIKMRQRIRLFAVDGRLYQALVVTPDFASAPVAADAFLDSFALL